MELKEILSWHLSRYPLIQAEDIIKLIYQGVFGPGHLLTDFNEKEVEERLIDEITRLTNKKTDDRRQKSGPLAPVIGRSTLKEETEPVDPDGLLVRVNLAPIANSPAHQVLLLKALKETIKNFTPAPALFQLRLEQAQEWCEKYLPNQKERLKILRQNLNLLPSHSAIYIQAYRPAYRVVFSRLWTHQHPF